MGNKDRNKRVPKKRSYRLKYERMIAVVKRFSNSPKSLVVLCQRVIKKHKLLPEPKKFTLPETFSAIGGKVLRKRDKEPPPRKNKGNKNSRRHNPKSLAELCRIVVRRYNLLPEIEETLHPSSDKALVEKNKPQSDGIEKRPRGRPRKLISETKIAPDCEVKRRRGRPRKDSCEASNSMEYNFSQVLSVEQPVNVKVEEELDLPPDVMDPLEDDDDFTVTIKEETDSDEEEGFTHNYPITSIPEVPQAAVVNQLPHIGIPTPSTIVAPRINLATVIMDQYQEFANSIANQLRAFPPTRALLLQLNIQSMIDNERQLISDEQ